MELYIVNISIFYTLKLKYCPFTTYRPWMSVSLFLLLQIKLLVKLANFILPDNPDQHKLLPQLLIS